MSFSVRLTKRWRETNGAKPARIEHQIDSACAAQVLPICASPTTLNFTTKLWLASRAAAASRCSTPHLLGQSVPPRIPAHSGGVAHLLTFSYPRSELFAKIAAPPYPGEASGPSTASRSFASLRPRAPRRRRRLLGVGLLGLVCVVLQLVAVL